MKRLAAFLLIFFFVLSPAASGSIAGSVEKKNLVLKITGPVLRVKVAVPWGGGVREVDLKKARLCNRKNPPDCYFNFYLKKKSLNKINKGKYFRLRMVRPGSSTPVKKRYRCQIKNNNLTCRFFDRVK